MSSAQQRRRPDPASTGVISTKQEEKLVQERVAIGAPVVYETIRRESEELSLLGNIVGGVALVAALAHAQVVGGKEIL